MSYDISAPYDARRITHIVSKKDSLCDGRPDLLGQWSPATQQVSDGLTQVFLAGRGDWAKEVDVSLGDGLRRGLKDNYLANPRFSCSYGLNIPATANAGFIHPAAHAGLIMPATHAGLNLPATHAGLNLPATIADLNLPATQAGLNLPATIADLNLPATQAGLNLPATQAGLNLPATQASLNLPSSCTDQVVFKNSETYLTFPPSLLEQQSGSINIPATIAGLKLPTTIAGLNVPATTADLNTPCSNQVVFRNSETYLSFPAGSNPSIINNIGCNPNTWGPPLSPAPAPYPPAPTPYPPAPTPYYPPEPAPYSPEPAPYLAQPYWPLLESEKAQQKQKFLKISQIRFINKTGDSVGSVAVSSPAGGTANLKSKVEPKDKSPKLLVFSEQLLLAGKLHVNIDTAGKKEDAIGTFIGVINLYEIAEVSNAETAHSIALPIRTRLSRNVQLRGLLKNDKVASQLHGEPVHMLELTALNNDK